MYCYLKKENETTRIGLDYASVMGLGLSPFSCTFNFLNEGQHSNQFVLTAKRICMRGRRKTTSSIRESYRHIGNSRHLEVDEPSHIEKKKKSVRSLRVELNGLTF